MDWYNIILLVIQAFITAVLGYFTFVQKKNINKFNAQNDLMLELSKPIYLDRIEASKKVFEVIEKTLAIAKSYDSKRKELINEKSVYLPSIDGQVDSQVNLIRFLLDEQYSELIDVLSKYSTYIVPAAQEFLNLYIMFYESLIAELKEILSYPTFEISEKDFSKPLENILMMQQTRDKVLRILQMSFDKFDILIK